MAGPLRPNPPPPSSLMTVEILERRKKGSKMARPLREELFFAASLTNMHRLQRPEAQCQQGARKLKSQFIIFTNFLSHNTQVLMKHTVQNR